MAKKRKVTRTLGDITLDGTLSTDMVRRFTASSRLRRQRLGFLSGDFLFRTDNYRRSLSAARGNSGLEPYICELKSSSIFATVRTCMFARAMPGLIESFLCCRQVRTCITHGGTVYLNFFYGMYWYDKCAR